MDKSVRIIKSLVMSYLITGGFLMVLALLLFRFQLTEHIVSIGIILIYIVASFAAGIYTGKYMDKRKFLWGALSGAVYFLILLGISLVVDKDGEDMVQQSATVLVLCIGAGMLGGMFA